MGIILTVLGIFLCALSLYIFAILPRITDRADMDLLSTDYAKGGVTDAGIPPYTLAAVSLACELGYGIELKCRLSKDGQIIVYPDAHLRACGANGKPEDYTCTELKSMRIAGSAHTVATLAEVLQNVDGRSPLILEPINTAHSNLMLTRLVKLLDRYGGAFAIASSDINTLVWFKNYRTRYARGQIILSSGEKQTTVGNKKKNKFVSFLYRANLLNFRTRPDFLIARRQTARAPSFKLYTLLFRTKAFIRPVRTQKEYKFCRSNGFFAVFERFRP